MSIPAMAIARAIIAMASSLEIAASGLKVPSSYPLIIPYS